MFTCLSVWVGQCEHIARPDTAGALHHPEIKLQRNGEGICDYRSWHFFKNNNEKLATLQCSTLSWLSCVFLNKVSLVFSGFRTSRHWKIVNGDFNQQQEWNWRCVEKETVIFMMTFLSRSTVHFAFKKSMSLILPFTLGSYISSSIPFRNLKK